MFQKMNWGWAGWSLNPILVAQYRRGKRKRLAPSDCWSLSNSSVGAFSLTQPFSYMGTGRDLHRGLYPRNRKTASQLCPLQRQPAGDANRLSENATSGKVNIGQSHSEVDFVFDLRDFLSSDLSIENDVFVLNSNSSRERPVLSLGCSNKNDDVGWDGSTRNRENARATFQQNSMRTGVIGAELEIDPLPDSYFGLLGCTGSHTQPSGHISQLPDEILRAVFSHLPAVDLYSFRLVCQQWRRVLSDPMFVPWKKLYYRYRKGEGSAVMEIDKILKANNITKGDEMCVLNLIRYVASFQHWRSVNSEAVLNCLKDHPLFNQSKLCVSHTLLDVIRAARTIRTWAIQAMIVLLSNSVQEIQRLISCLGRPCSTLPPMELMEVLYCMATLLFALRVKDIGISNRIHYNLFCALYLRENPATVCRKHPKHLCSPQDSDSLERDGVYRSPELERMLNLEIVPGDVIKIMGFAGTGKTSLLIEYARRRPHLQFLYVLPTKPVPEEVGYLFPPNVECTTMHTKAYQCVGYKYHQKKKLMICGLKPFAASKFPEGQGSLSRANLICRSLSNFFSSVDESITVAHVPGDCKSTHGGTGSMEHHEKLELVEDAKRIWKKMVDLCETSYLMTHDGYLKLWQLNKPSLSQFDVILVDEAEDCSPDIILSQKCGKILVGDPHQQISSFKGTVEALFEAHHPQLFSLKQSFRFGPEIAYVAATILEVCKQFKDKTLVGGNQDGNTVENSVGQAAILCKTTAAVFDEAVRIVTSNNPTKIYFIGGLDKFGMDIVLDIWMLTILEVEQAAKDLVIRDPFIRMFERKGGLRGLRNYAVQVEDSELEERIAVVEKYGLRLPVLVEKITNHCVNCPSFANVVLGTVHKAKGLEFEMVQIAEDLIKVPGFRHNTHVLSGFKIDLVPDVDWNLLYIAVTRAKRRLVMSRSLECLLSFANEYFLKPELTTNLLGKGLSPKCHIGGCLNRITSEAVLTMRKASSPQCAGEDAGGPLCCVCVRQRIGPLIYLLASPELVKSRIRTGGRGCDPP
ncbi:F-box DNA helicase 1 isoform X1 [Pristis pectinata]|uniref:F-box DNA helicase 1 isoform X1 n=1 Tax=Pristis pectinata TaxID=685728 RepID=UPI00223D4D14|nr:F-box DNA helicase 1 isoform X1 [Pristis pectinata]